ncbi:uncharacterized protein CC84DRAFT_1164689 [Paraphaeosphaeria sporulosa]|uniref:ZZ-type domain-containing protein n=1 Tax=Paraphaeosphaeria sporulosa TaxID=1460663 RepID=A0A177CHJ9_9PLEO|nr:uncharacterized protein CC84DRAFT_1164689 [Paraphaeosphaeria sporulosa]OAG06422.1 hypothetical protein CC84DRAFT_1164689 [Paraphaeosphaeria sporulosa]
MATNVPVTLDTLIVVKIQVHGANRRFKVPLRDLGANVFPEKLRHLLQVPPGQEVIFERYSDSAGAYVTLDANKPQVYKTLFRAAKAKLKLRLRATIPGQENEPAPAPPSAPVHQPLSTPPSSLHRMSAETLSPPRAEATLPPPLIAHSSTLFSTASQSMAAQTSPVSPVVADAEVKGEAPVPRPFTATTATQLSARQSFFSSLAAGSRNADLAFRPKMETVQTSWVVYCNNCNIAMEDEHYHCSICDHGDYDLCPSCVESGIHCPGSGHWMVKRFVKNGSVVNSNTERLTPRKPQAEHEMPGAFTEEKQSVPEVVQKQEAEEPTRTCNCCVQILHEREFVTCTICDDYDLCMQCHIDNKHGHHPGHAFKAATEQTSMPALADFLCNAGRNVRHSAVCDGCEKFIYGVRHKCLNCPDWDFCSECIKSAKFIHPAHRFVPIYEPLAEPVSSGNRHYGIYCDGPLCKDKEGISHIEGIRYKCAICHDTDFCANCEAHPSNRHNQTHPLLKFKRPVRSVNVTTLNEDKDSKSITRVGDREDPRRSFSSEAVPASPSNAATQVQTIVDVKPTEEPQPKTTKDKIEIRDLLSEPIMEKVPVTVPVPVKETEKEATASAEFDAHFVRDSIADGTKVCSGFQFVQVWTLRNPGPNSWPAGCSVRHVGGDNMLDLDNTRALSQSELAEASESNVIGRSVAPGEEVAFRIVLKAPVREGTAISYWRLKTAEGMPFGHRLWCDIQVTSPPAPASPLAQAPVDAEASTLSVSDQTLQQQALRRLEQVHQKMSELSEREALSKIEAERLLRIQKVRKAAVERVMEARRREQDLALRIKAVRALENAPEMPIKAETAELPAEKEVPEKVVEKEAEIGSKPEVAPHSSGMIFPQLDKESPASSTHEAVAAPPDSPRPASVTTATVSDEDFFEDAESVELISDEEDDGFMTDEEYDILESADESFP